MRELETSAADPLRVRLMGDCGLSPLDFWLVCLCTAAERFAEAAAALSILAEDQRTQLPTPTVFAQLMEPALGEPRQASLLAALGGGAAARLGLLEAADPAAGRPLTHQPLRVRSAELPALLAGEAAAVAAAETGESLEPAAECVHDSELVELAAGLLEQSRLLCLRCSSPRAGRQLALDVAGKLRLRLRLLSGVDADAAEGAAWRSRRELPALDLTGVDVASGDLRRQLTRLRAAAPRALLLAGESAELGALPALTVPRLGPAEALRAWRAAVADPEQASELARRFALSLPEAREAVKRADRLASAYPFEPQAERIARPVLEEGARRMGKLVTHLRSPARLDNVVGPPALELQLREIVAWARASYRVFGEMALGRLSPLGRGLTCLFSGPPGTGKTFAALCLANELGLNLYRIDLSQVVSKYIGETEKALAKVFDEAEAGHGVLLFDEADALFGKRSEVKDAHDRYANIEVGYLLQRLETFEGVAILATNLRSNLDPAFVRRLRFLLDFPMPDEEMRRKLWEQALPAERHRDPELDVTPFVGRFRLSGGSIQNVALAAAHLAAAEPEGRIRERHLVRAAYRELEKTGQTRSRRTFGPLAAHLPEDLE